MSELISIKQFIKAIEKLPSDTPRNRPGKWYTSQKQHWLGWLREYHTPGAYGRQVKSSHDARFAYNHIVNHEMLLWIIDAAGVDKKLGKSVNKSIKGLGSMQQKSAAIRKIVPWNVLSEAFWG
jgi:hypothetical protein